MKNTSIFEFNSYRDFLTSITELRGKRGGMKSELAKAMGSHPAYLSRVLAGKANLSLEQAERIAAHLELDSDEKRYFIFVVEEERAGTHHLKKFFKEEREQMQRKRMNIRERIPASRQVSMPDQSVYYSSWHYSAIHVLMSFLDDQNPNAVAAFLDLPLATVNEAIRFLEGIRVLEPKKSGWTVKERHLHIDKASPFIRQHHTNWRLKALQTLDRVQGEDLRYSAVFSMSEEDATILREKMMGHLKDYLEIVSASPEEKPYVYCFDFFELGKQAPFNPRR